MSSNSCDHEFHYYLETNEAGWKCCCCGHKPGEPEGYSPQLDRELIGTKAHGLLLELHEARFIYVSNGSHGESLSAHVAKRCRDEGLFDQYSVLRFLLEAVQPGHATFWKEVSDGIIAGEDPRDRCPCGALSTRSVGRGGGGWFRFCSEHGPGFEDDPAEVHSALVEAHGG